jgi:flagellar L-ring protein precursor FlgH
MTRALVTFTTVVTLTAALGVARGQSSSLYVNQPHQPRRAASPQSDQEQSARQRRSRQAQQSRRQTQASNRRRAQPGRNASRRRAPESVPRINPAQRRQPRRRVPQGPTAFNQRNNTATGERQAPHRLAPAIREQSLAAVEVPKPRQFAVHDLVTIIIREQSETEFQASLETEKGTEHSAEIAELPRLTLSDLADLQLKPNDFEDGTPQLDVSSDREFEGEGDYSRSEEMSGRITARIIDIKPNNTLVLEARKFVKSDDESLNIRLTGTCRAEDITADNTVLSTELYDLHLNKTHDGELRKSTKKGLFTDILDFVFNF